MSRPQRYLIVNTSQSASYQRGVICICIVTSGVERKHRKSSG